MRVLPRVQCKLSFALHAIRRVKLLQNLRNQEITLKRTMMSLERERKRGAMAVVGCLGISQEVTKEDSL